MIILSMVHVDLTQERVQKAYNHLYTQVSTCNHYITVEQEEYANSLNTSTNL